MHMYKVEPWNIEEMMYLKQRFIYVSFAFSFVYDCLLSLYSS